MSFKQFILRNLKKNLKNYYLYVFALTFSVALYFAFVTLQNDPLMDSATGSIKGEAAMRTGSVMLVTIVTVFLIYANNLFIKRRSKEIGLLQLVGMTKGKIFQILTGENFILYFSSVVLGIFLGFVSSKLAMMILIKIIGLEEVAELQFSSDALMQTVIVFAAIYIVIMLLNAFFIRRHRILTLFNVTSTSENKRRRVSVFESIIGIFGIGLIIFGYYLSTKLFNGDFSMMEQMFVMMLIILGSVILGTFLFYKGSISFIFNLLRKNADGYLPIHKVLSLSSIMFRMKSNSLLLTVITTVSALALGLLSLSYIAYYSVEKSTRESIVYDFSIPDKEHAAQFTFALEEKGIDYTKKELDLVKVNADVTNILDYDEKLSEEYEKLMVPLVLIPDSWTEDMDVSSTDSVFAVNSKANQAIMSFEEGEFTFVGKSESTKFNHLGMNEGGFLPARLTNGLPVAVVDERVYEQLKKDMDPDPEIQGEFSVHVGIDIVKRSDLAMANKVFQELELDQWAGHESQLEQFQENKRTMGLTMFIVGFLGLSFLVTSGCILYFKQMDEGEEEKANYTILRKLGFTTKDILDGIRVKQLFNFGIPLIIGISHSYFAVKSGWFFFGTEMYTPMVIVMVLYILLYSIFGILSVVYYKRIVQDAL